MQKNTHIAHYINMYIKKTVHCIIKYMQKKRTYTAIKQTIVYG